MTWWRRKQLRRQSLLTPVGVAGSIDRDTIWHTTPSSTSSQWLLDWPTYGRTTSWSYPGSYNATLTSLAALTAALATGTGVAAGQNVLVTGSWTSSTEITATYKPATAVNFYFDDGHQPGGTGVPCISQAVTANHPPALWIATATNLSFYGAVFDGAAAAGTSLNGSAVQIGGVTNQTVAPSKIIMRGCLAKNWGAGGFFSTENLTVGGVSLPPTGLDIDMEITNTGLNIGIDSHGDGTGIHAAYIGGTNGSVSHTGTSNSKFSFYSHDISGCYGDVQAGQGSWGNEFWVRGKNLTFRNTPNHPASIGTQAAWKCSPCLTFWGNSNDSTNIVHTVEAVNVYGLAVEAESLNTGGATVQHGRQHSALVDPDCAAYYSNQPYYAIAGMTYNDCS